MRPLLRALMGPRHRLQLALSLVLSGLLRLHDYPSRRPGYSKMSEEVRRCLDGVREEGAMAFYSSKIFPLSFATTL